MTKLNERTERVLEAVETPNATIAFADIIPIIREQRGLLRNIYELATLLSGDSEDMWVTLRQIVEELEQAGISLAEGEVSANCEANSTTSEQGGE